MAIHSVPVIQAEKQCVIAGVAAQWSRCGEQSAVEVKIVLGEQSFENKPDCPEDAPVRGLRWRNIWLCRPTGGCTWTV